MLASALNLLAGLELTARPTILDGVSEPTARAQMLVAGIEWVGVRSPGQRNRLLEWTMTGRVKVGTGHGDDASDEGGSAKGGQVGARVDYGVVLGGTRCARPYLSAGAGSGLHLTSIKSDTNSDVRTSASDAQYYHYVRAGLGLACVSDELTFVVSPFVAQRADIVLYTHAVTEFGSRTNVTLAGATSASLEVATASFRAEREKGNSTRAAATVRARLGKPLTLGADASISRYNLESTSDSFSYRERVTPYAITMFAALTI